ncbi:ABC transporter permease [Deinococcus peraridilitoris]|uniref:ABC-type dipeptide/oligopeptide/nickel transport system, permease component n=1 Tax=Deinococcus peraridilitoris (strain DSM 19664 / LMG 22246 / CIP 109416 / KR-200) TaxID=937777 RepID=L0A8G4_DEIPD|nr:ABC transporter permease [Deinococcus peraridilitoris]AFZ69467.1 ABC-type dipeptide/oligopeptide/nickel transport system, permease component [Deinococcus peraridilitoris DSM 19664]
MLTYLIKRLLDLLIVLFGVSILVFLMIRLIPGDAVQIMLGANIEVTPEQIAQLRARLGLDRPILLQYWSWLGNALRGDLGESVWTGAPISREILGRLPVTLELTLLPLLLATLLAVPLGILTAAWRNSTLERVIRFVTIAGITTPAFWLGTLFIYIAFVLAPGWPTIGYVPFSQDPLGHFSRLILPTIALALPMLAGLVRILRSSLLEVLGQDFIRTARSKGLPERRVLYKHALRNALVPLLTVLGIQAGYLFGGAIVIEQVFAIPGFGRLIVGAINERNYALVQGAILVVTAGFVVINFFVDLLYSVVDPRVEYA